VSAATVVLASVRGDVADYVSAVFVVYLICIFAYVVTSILFAVGVRPPYSRWSSAVLDFLRQVVEPYLNLFRRFLPNLGPFDLSPMVATIVLIIVQQVVVGLIRG